MSRLPSASPINDQPTEWTGAPRTSLTRVAPLLIGLLIVLGLALRVYRLDVQSFWNDEGTTIQLVTRPLPTITRDASHDIHPPFYYYVLHYWTFALGRSEFAARSLSALLGALLVALSYRLGIVFFGVRTALLAALFSAISPLQVYYAQEARMYMLAAVLGAGATLCFWELVKHPKSPRWLLPPKGMPYVILMVLTLYTHYFGVTLLIAHNLGWLALTMHRWIKARRIARRGPLPAWITSWIVAQAIITFAYLPWVWLSRDQLLNWPMISEPFGPLTLLRRAAVAFSLGLTVPETGWPLGIAAVLAVLAILGLYVPLRQNAGEETPWSGATLSLFYCAIPLLSMYVISVRRPMYDPKFLLLATPGFHVLAARGLERLCPRKRRTLASVPVLLIAGIAALLVVGGTAYSLQNLYFDPRYARDDYRGIAEHIRSVSREGDTILINAPSQIETFSYYYDEELSIYTLPRHRPINEEETRAELSSLPGKHQRIFAIFWATDESDPNRVIEGWLDRHGHKALDDWYGNVRLVVYALTEETPGQIDREKSAQLGERIRFLGYSIPSKSVRAGDILSLTLFWQASRPVEQRYKVFTHVLDHGGHIVGQRDAEPGGGARLTTTWQTGETIVDPYGLLIRPGTAPGEYAVEIGMYALDGGARLPVTVAGELAGDRIVLEPIRVSSPDSPPRVSGLQMMAPIVVECGPVNLLGYDLYVLGTSHRLDVPAHAGDVLELALYWQAQPQSRTEVVLHIELIDSAEAVRWSTEGLLVEGRYPLARWKENEIIRDPRHITLPGDLDPGRYALRLRVEPILGDSPLADLMLTNVSVQ